MLECDMFLDRESVTGRRHPAKMLRKWGLGRPVYVSAKRTHRFWQAKQGLSDCGANRSDRKCNRFSVGSFWKTNPPERCFGAVLGSSWRVFGRFRNSRGVEMLRTCKLRKYEVCGSAMSAVKALGLGRRTRYGLKTMGDAKHADRAAWLQRRLKPAATVEVVN